MIRESAIERRFVKLAKELGCLVYKLHERGAPDRLVITPDNKVAFVELKRPNAKPRPEQRYEHERLRARGLDVYVVDTKALAVETLSTIVYGSPHVLTKKGG
jgi:hypothetical protein